MWSATSLRSSRTRGALFGLSAAALFGVSAPMSKLLLGQMQPQMLAALLYLGAGLGLLLFRGRRSSAGEAPLRKADWPYAAAIAISGGMIAPVLMLHGLRQVSGVAGSLLLNLEAPFTIAIAVLFFREHLARREGIAAAIILLGGATLTLESDAPSEATLVGVLLIAGACAAWAIDNNLTQKLSLKDPKALVRIKTLSAGTMNLLIAWILGQRLPSATVIAAAALLGFFSYGVSILLDAYALRDLGAAREAAFFSTAPFFGWSTTTRTSPTCIIATSIIDRSQWRKIGTLRFPAFGGCEGISYAAAHSWRSPVCIALSRHLRTNQPQGAATTADERNHPGHRREVDEKRSS